MALLAAFLRDKNFTPAGRKIELVVVDTAGVPATAKTKTVELGSSVDRVDLIMGPLATFGNGYHLATIPGEHKMPTMGFGGAEDLAQLPSRSLSGANFG